MATEERKVFIGAQIVLADHRKLVRLAETGGRSVASEIRRAIAAHVSQKAAA